MEQSILNSTKKILGMSPDYTAFDQDVLTFINTAFGVLNQLGLTDENLFIDDESLMWGDLGLSQSELNLARTYVFLRVKLLFDPPPTSFAIDAAEKQLAEYESRLSYMREATVTPP